MIIKKSISFSIFLIVLFSLTAVTPVFSKSNETASFNQVADIGSSKNIITTGIQKTITSPNNIINYNLPLGEAYWLMNGNNIYNSNIGSVGIGTTNPRAKLEVVGKIVLDDGASNVAIGVGALSFVSPSSGTGMYNTAVGQGALSSTINGYQNTAIGHWALGFSLGNLNSAFGDNALGNLISGSGNVAFGQGAGGYLTSGNNNTFLGTYAGSDSRQKIDAVNSTAIGYNSYTTKDNQIMIGNEDVTETVINGNISAIDISVPNIRNLHWLMFNNNGSDRFISIDEGAQAADLKILAGSTAPEAGGGRGGDLYLFGGQPSKTGNGGNVYITPSNGGIYGGLAGNVIIASSFGNVGIGTTNPQQALSVVGQVWASGGYLSGSDLHWQKNISPLSGTLNKVLKLKPVTFSWRVAEFPNMKFSNERQLGLVAQEVELIFPEAVFTNENGYKSINYDKLIPVLIQAIKDQQKRIDYLETAIKAPTNFK